MTDEVKKLIDIFYHFNPSGTNEELAEFVYHQGVDAGFAKCEKAYGLSKDE